MVEDGEGLLCGLVLVNVVVVIVEEGGLLDDSLVLLYDICVARWQSLFEYNKS